MSNSGTSLSGFSDLALGEEMPQTTCFSSGPAPSQQQQARSSSGPSRSAPSGLSQHQRPPAPAVQQRKASKVQGDGMMEEPDHGGSSDDDDDSDEESGDDNPAALPQEHLYSREILTRMIFFEPSGVLPTEFMARDLTADYMWARNHRELMERHIETLNQELSRSPGRLPTIIQALRVVLPDDRIVHDMVLRLWRRGQTIFQSLDVWIDRGVVAGSLDVGDAAHALRCWDTDAYAFCGLASSEQREQLAPTIVFILQEVCKRNVNALRSTVPSSMRPIQPPYLDTNNLFETLIGAPPAQDPPFMLRTLREGIGPQHLRTNRQALQLLSNEIQQIGAPLPYRQNFAHLVHVIPD